MQTHSDFDTPERREFMKKLRERAAEMRQNGTSGLAGGCEEEKELARWKAHGVQVVVRPDDPQGILRISVGGGGKTPVRLDYCTIRGGVGECIEQLQKTIEALKACPF